MHWEVKIDAFGSKNIDTGNMKVKWKTNRCVDRYACMLVQML